MADQYAREAARVSALQLAYHAGFDVAQESCVEILADLLLRYLNEVGAGSHHFAELAGRSETNAVDVVRRGVMRACSNMQRLSKLGVSPPLPPPPPAHWRVTPLHSVLQALALNGMGTSIEQLRDFKQHSKVGAAPHLATAAACCLPALAPDLESL